MKQIAINSKHKELCYAAITLHSIEDFNWDPRENIIRLSIIWYVAEKLNIDPMQLFDSVASISSSKAAEYFQEFIKRPKELKSLNAMGLAIKKEGENISFVPKPPPWEKKI
jgi:hypothetical protein